MRHTSLLKSKIAAFTTRSFGVRIVVFAVTKTIVVKLGGGGIHVLC
jgi:hypothetical protein